MATWKRIFLTTASLLLLICVLPGCGVPKEEYNKVKSDLEATQIELSQVTDELTQRNTELKAQVKQVQADNVKLMNDNQRLMSENVKLMNDNQRLMSEHLRLMAELEQSLVPPYTAISGREITWAFKDMDGNLQKWTLPVDSYRSWIEITKLHKTVLLNCDGKTYTMVDYRPYVHTEAFSKVIPNFYQQCADEWDFAQEVFNLVSQLTVYSEDIGEVPRWPVETLTEAGGDCEDLAILFASLLKAAPYPYKLSLVYMDADNPTDPQYPNHVIVKVETNDWRVFVECTNDQGWGYWKEVVGWFFEL